MESSNRTIRGLLDLLRESQEGRLEIVEAVRGRLIDLSPDLPHPVHDLAVLSAITKTLNAIDASDPALTLNPIYNKEEMCRNLSAVCINLLQMKRLPGWLLVDLLRILRGPLLGRVALQCREVAQLYHLVSVLDNCTSNEAQKELWLCYPKHFETALTFACFVLDASESGRCHLVEECAKDPKLFCAAASVLSSVCRASEGDLEIVRASRAFFASVLERLVCLDDFLRLFPERLHSILFAMHLPWKELPQKVILVQIENLCSLALSGLHRDLFSVGDIGMLAVVVPDWYDVLLEAAVAGISQTSSLANNLLANLWSFKCSHRERHLAAALKEISF